MYCPKDICKKNLHSNMQLCMIFLLCRVVCSRANHCTILAMRDKRNRLKIAFRRAFNNDSFDLTCQQSIYRLGVASINKLSRMRSDIANTNMKYLLVFTCKSTGCWSIAPPPNPPNTHNTHIFILVLHCPVTSRT